MAPDGDDRNDGDDPDEEGDGLEGLLEIVHAKVVTGEPLDLLGLASATLAIVVHADAVDIDEELLRERVVEDIVERYVTVGTSDSLAFAAALTEMVTIDELRTRLRRTLEGARSELPAWLAGLDQAGLERTSVVRDLFDDDEWLLAGVRLVDGRRITFRVEIDHAADGAVSDGILMPTTVDDVTTRLRATSSEDEVLITEVTAEEFAGRYGTAVLTADAAGEDRRTETWPASRPFIEWAIRQAPVDRRTSG